MADDRAIKKATRTNLVAFFFNETIDNITSYPPMSLFEPGTGKPGTGKPNTPIIHVPTHAFPPTRSRPYTPTSRTHTRPRSYIRIIRTRMRLYVRYGLYPGAMILAAM